ncbi:MFS transporter [Kitasatospora sp. NPDC049285]|uniref:MFS transporter n=1 Tax=Kitasatospora sp. NPDC049285 TaxID=3157096 RepID=UPI0034157C91
MTGTDEATDDAAARHRAAVFWRYWTASTISGAGDAVTAVALPLVAVEMLHATATDVGWITAAGFAAWLLIGLPAGVLVHRMPLRRVQVAMDVVRALAIASIPVAAWLGALHLVHLIAVALVVGLATVVFDVGNSSFLTSVVDKRELTARNSLMSGTYSANQTGGPALGGVLVQLLGAAATLVVDAVSYLASAVLLRTLPRGEHEAGGGADGPMLARIREGWRYVTRHPVMGPSLAAVTAINFVCGGLLTLMPVFLVTTLGAPPGLVGVLYAAEGAGSLVGAALATKLVNRLGNGPALRLAATVTAVAGLLMPMAWHGWGLILFALGNAGFSAGTIVTSVITRTHRQAVTPPELLPRVMATVRFVSWGAIPFGSVAAGFAASAWGTRGAFWLVAALAFACPAVLLAGPIRRLRDLDTAPAAP